MNRRRRQKKKNTSGVKPVPDSEWEKLGFERITKEEAARRQLVTAIQLYFGGGDQLSIYCLSVAAYDILSDLALQLHKTDAEIQGWALPGLVSQLASHFNMSAKTVKELIRRPQNFFKHADQDNPLSVAPFNPKTVDFYLSRSAQVYGRIFKDRVPAEIKAFSTWHTWRDPQTVIRAPLPPKIEALRQMVLSYSDEQRADCFQRIMLTMKSD
jgi:hypothetical protein